MYDYPSTLGPVKDECPECKAIESKKQELGSRYNSLSYTADDYDRKKGKGSFKKDFSDADKLMNAILKEKTSLIVDHEFQHAMHEQKESPEIESEEHDTGVPVI
jgi:hypothetical protein